MFLQYSIDEIEKIKNLINQKSSPSNLIQALQELIAGESSG